MKSNTLLLIIAFVGLIALNLFFIAESEEPQVQPKDSVRTVVDTFTVVDTVLLLKQSPPCTVYVEVGNTRVIEDIFAKVDTTLNYNSGCVDSLHIEYSLLRNTFKIQNTHIGRVVIEKETRYQDTVDFVSLWGVFCVSKGIGYGGNMGFDVLFKEKYLTGLRVGTDKSIGINVGIKLK